ncbi:unnamed protein product [Lactuca saligna]|uniref:Late embryogenesis abundant protein LEA-2 subgroup domain-containing protein n=1 Tax=Lactuca saligna TaxID=75948 RepID=A0AA36E172_LACSI|nr:unnamed protein product [Lactuca saligna]
MVEKEQVRPLAPAIDRHHTARDDEDTVYKKTTRTRKYVTWYKNTTTNLYYRGMVIGVARGLPGQSKARRTTRMNITMDIMVDRLLENPNLQSDIGTGLLNMSNYTIVGGRVKLLTIIKKHVIVSMNCTMRVNIINRAIEDQNCKKKVKI